MCAIAGVINFAKKADEYEKKEVRRMLDCMTHRGPDYSGTESVDHRGVLGSNRLCITDPDNKEAHMPMYSNDRSCCIVFNGEIYNHKGLRKHLTGYPFRTRSDTEVILAAYQAWGKECVDRFEGMFAFCLYDFKTKSFFFAIDPSGQKPLYYLIDEHALVFASEIEALIFNNHRKKTWDVYGIAEAVAVRYTIGADTHVKEIKKLRSGHWMICNEQGIRIHQYYTVPIGDQARSDSAAITRDIAETVHAGCTETFDLEVPYGMLLSGGVDSSSVLAEACKAHIPMNTFSIGFQPLEGETFGERSIFDEFAYSRLIARTFGTRHTEIVINSHEYFHYLKQWIDIMGEPLGSQEAVCLCKLFGTVKETCRVIFCGSGPDEVFDGYANGYFLANKPGVTPENITSHYYDSFLWLFDVQPDHLMPGIDVRSRVIAKLEDFLEPYRSRVEDVLQLTQLINFHGRCVSYEYRQMDTISLANSVEVRTPLADRRVTAAAFNCAPGLKNMNGDEKWIFKQAMKRLLPDTITSRKKAPFPIPKELWFTEEYETMVAPLLDDQSPLFQLDILDKDYVRFAWASGNPNMRNVFYRLLVINRVMEKQKGWVNNSPAPSGTRSLS